MINILLVEDHQLVRQAWRNLLHSQSEYRIIGEAETCKEALAFIRTTSLDIILLDVNLKGENGSTIISTICNILPHPKIIIVSMNSEFSFVKSMFKLGAMGYITKNASIEDMLLGIKEVSNGGKFLSQDLKNLFANNSVEKIEKLNLTIKELEIIKHISCGLSNKEIAALLNISEKTVEGRKTIVYKKLQVKNNVGLLKYATDNGLI